MENMGNVTVFNSQHNANSEVFSIVSYMRGKKQNMQEIGLQMQ